MQKIVIIGKKNVGKSSLFNLLTKTNNAISINYPGYTRDCNSTIAKIKSNTCEIIDTAGLGQEKTKLDYITLKNTWKIIKRADIIIVLYDINNINNPVNINISNTVKKIKKKKIYVINKIDTINKKNNYIENKINLINEIYIAVKKNIGINTLIEKIDNYINMSGKQIEKKIYNTFKISIVGQPNVGKSSLTNQLANSNKMIIHNQVGTTRDNINLNIIKNKKIYNIIDTPGIKKKSI